MLRSEQLRAVIRELQSTKAISTLLGCAGSGKSYTALRSMKALADDQAKDKERT